jgi:hypothetical protein
MYIAHFTTATRLLQTHYSSSFSTKQETALEDENNHFIMRQA